MICTVANQQMNEYIITFVFWATSTLHFNKYGFKIARNCTSTIHAAFVLIFFTFGISPMDMLYVTTGYYLFDCIIESIELIKHHRLYNFGMVLHHAVSMYVLSYLQDPTLCEYIYYSFFIIEVSNFPVYLVYYLKSIKYGNEILIRLLILLEITSFTICRIMIYGTMLLHGIKMGIPFAPLLCGALIYIMSVIWLYGMVLQFIR